MTLVFPIVGMRHCLPEDALPDLIASLPLGAEVALCYDKANPYDRYAIQAWMDLSVDGAIQKKQVGYVSADYAPIIRANYPNDSLLYAHVVHPETSVLEDSCFEAEIEVDKLEIPVLPQRIDLGEIAHIPLPMVPPVQQMQFENIMAYSQTLSIEADEVLALAQQSVPYWGHSLSGDERTAYTLLSTMLTFVHGKWTNLTESIWQARLDLAESHHAAFHTPECCAKVMHEEMQLCQQGAASFFDQYKAAIDAGLTTREQELQAHQRWLMALPDNLYAHVKDTPVFASKLYYERFSIEELYAIYLHLLCVEWLNGQISTHLPDFAEQAIAAFSFWAPSASLAKKREVVKKIRAAAMQPREHAAAIALCLKQAQKNNVMVPILRPFAKMVKELNNFLDHPVKENSLRHRYFPKIHDAYDNV
ncbi:MAG: hypothetical protein MJZ48_04450 [Paludibacteraceae bacterium]|nr:hypothetical protein [Paludibacteraceae bacterium]